MGACAYPAVTITQAPTMTPTLRYGFIGCGMMGQEHLRNLALLPGSQVTRIFEPNDSMAVKAMALALGAVREASLEAVAQATDVDALVITSPNDCHAGQLRQLQALGGKPVLMEKPAATTLDDVRSLATLARSYPSPVWVAMEYRYMPPVAQVLQTVHDGQALGPATLISIREHRFPFLEKVLDWNRFNVRTGGTLVEKCCHFFDLMRLITRSEPVRIYASASQAHNHLGEQYGGATPDILDNAYVVVDFASGQRALLELCMFAEGSRYQEEISVVGPNAKVECFVPGPGRFWPAHLGAAPLPKVVLSPRSPPGPQELNVPVDASLLAAGDHNGSTYYQHERFRRAVLASGPVEVGLRDGLAAVLMGMAAQASALRGQAVDMLQGEFSLRDILGS
jgi:myo-inositol 2-dehydrogenase / D-chiro-inositol 1-dehydrogenase